MWADFCMKKSKPVTYTAVLTAYITQCELDIQIVLRPAVIPSVTFCIRDNFNLHPHRSLLKYFNCFHSKSRNVLNLHLQARLYLETHSLQTI